MAVTPATEAQIAKVVTYLPSVANDPEVWDATKVAENWTGGIAGTIRKFWYVRASDTAGYMDLPDAGGTLPITQIHRAAKDMLAYWDAFIAKWGANTDPDTVAGGIVGSVGKIKRRYQRTGVSSLDRYNARSPYGRA